MWPFTANCSRSGSVAPSARIGEEYIGVTVEGALRMQQLVNDLRAYTQASVPDATPSKSVCAREALDEALAKLAPAIRETQASVEISELPSVRIPRAHLVQLFEHLIGNSIKYRSADPLQIAVTAVRQQDGRWQFDVKDNGIGIDPRYHQQVFGVFKKLHGHRQYPGTGIGLAICRRIVDRHGGRIWVESNGDGSGSTFHILLPDGGSC